MVKTVDLVEAQTSLPELVSLVTSGTQVIVTQAGTPVVCLVPIDAPTAPRIPDLHPGAFEESDDFDAPLPDEFWTGDA
jgi:prevent-host-death family protein